MRYDSEIDDLRRNEDTPRRNVYERGTKIFRKVDLTSCELTLECMPVRRETPQNCTAAMNWNLRH